MRPIYQNGGFIGILGDYDSMEPYITSTPATIQFIGSRSAEFVGSTTVGTTITIESLNLQYGDLVIVAYEACGTVNKPLSISGYTTVANLYANDTEDSNFLVAYKFMGLIPDTDIVIPPTQNAADAGAVVVHVYRGVNLEQPFDVSSTTATLLNTAIPNPPAITPVTQGAKIVVAAGAAHTVGTAGLFSAGYLSNFVTTAGNDTNDATVGIGHVDWPGVTTYDPAAWSFTGTNSTNFSTNSVTMALRPGFEFGNKKNSGIWNLVAERRTKTSGKSAGEVEFIAPGTYNWIVPIGVDSISAVAIGGGGGGGARDATDEPGAGGGGGGLAYDIIATTPGETLTITVGTGGVGGQGAGTAGTAGGASEILRNTTALLRATGGAGGGGGRDATGGAGGTSAVGLGGNGGNGGNSAQVAGQRGGGGGAGGYSGNGGNGGNNGGNGSTGAGGGGGGGGGTSTGTTTGGGGGVNIYGQGANGAAGTASVNATGGSGGASATYAGGLYGGGGSGGGSTNRLNFGASGAVRIIWGAPKGEPRYEFPSNAPSGITGVDINFGVVYPTYIKQF